METGGVDLERSKFESDPVTSLNINFAPQITVCFCQFKVAASNALLLFPCPALRSNISSRIIFKTDCFNVLIMGNVFLERGGNFAKLKASKWNSQQMRRERVLHNCNEMLQHRAVWKGTALPVLTGFSGRSVLQRGPMVLVFMRCKCCMQFHWNLPSFIVEHVENFLRPYPQSMRNSVGLFSLICCSTGSNLRNNTS